MASIRVGAGTHQKLKNIANRQGSKLADLLDEMTSLLVNVQLSPVQLQAKLEAASQMDSFQKLLTEQVAKVIKAIGQQERNYLFPFSKELAMIKDRTEQLAANGVKKEIFANMLKITQQAFNKKKAKGGGPNKLTTEQMLLMTLEYFKRISDLFPYF